MNAAINLHPMNWLKMNTTKGTILFILLVPLIAFACEPILNKIAAAQNVIESSNPSRTQTRTLTVFAAASLTDAFKEIGAKFETENPGVRVNLNFAGSQILRMQLEQGARADIFASADHKNMDALATESLIITNSYKDFAANRLIVILPPENPGKLENLDDLAKANLKLILADPSVPAGNYARQVLTKMSEDPVYGENFASAVLANLVSNETDVRQVVTKVELGESDAGIVYLSDVVAVKGLGTLTIPERFNIIAQYPIAILSTSSNPNLAEEFIAYVISPAGQAILEKWGFTVGE
jgi:molybdate transport system substrate-binding protein